MLVLRVPMPEPTTHEPEFEGDDAVIGMSDGKDWLVQPEGPLTGSILSPLM